MLARIRGGDGGARSGERYSFAGRFAAGFGTVAATLLALPAAAFLLPEASRGGGGA